MFGLVDGNNFFVSCERVFDPSLNGRAVAVLSNNDGCCISRSNEFKALGIAMGTPYFQLKDRERAGELVFRSSNYELYADMSRRILAILRAAAVDVEPYSIDEAFVRPPSGAARDPARWGAGLRARVLRWVGIPCGVGFAATKTLAKIANHIGKKRPDGVFVMPADPAPILDALPVEEVWGVGRRLSARLRARGVFTAGQFARMREADVQAAGGVTLLRTALELRGTACAEHRPEDADPESISCSRSFGEPVTTRDALAESLAAFTARAAEKLRRHGLLATGCNIFAQTARGDLYTDTGAMRASFTGRTVMFPAPTDATNVMLAAVRRAAAGLFTEGQRYRKSGMVFFGLEKAGAARQPDFFDTARRDASPLYRAVDALNARHGRGTVVTAAQGFGGTPAWSFRREKRTPRFTTCWNELLTVR